MRRNECAANKKQTQGKQYSIGNSAMSEPEKQKSFGSSLKRFFHWSSRNTSRVEQETPRQMRRSKSDKDVVDAFTVDQQIQYNSRSATLPSPKIKRSPIKDKESPSPTIPTSRSSPKRHQTSYHTPVTLGTPLSPPIPHPCYSPRSDSISYATMRGPRESSNLKLQLNKIGFSDTGTMSSTSTASSGPNYSEPYHWLVPTPQQSRPSAPPLPPRTYLKKARKKYMNCDIPESKSMVNLSNRTSPEYMSINPSTLNPSVASDYQQPIVTQRTPLPPCIAREKQKRLEQSSASEDPLSPSCIESERETICRSKRTTVVILNDDRTLQI